MRKKIVARRFTDLIESFLFKSSRTSFVIVMIMFSIAKSGVWYVPHFGLLTKMAEDPWSNPFSDPNGQYNFYNWFGPFVAWILQMRSFKSYFFFNFGLGVAFLLVVIFLFFRSFPERTARIAIIIFSALPVASIAFYWIGYDSMTLFLLSLILLCWKKWYVVLVLGVFVGMQHFEQAVIGFAGVCLFYVLKYKFNLRNLSSPIAILIGVGIGKVLLGQIFAFNGIEINSGRDYYLKMHQDIIITAFAYHPQIFLFTSLGLAWLPMIYLYSSVEKAWKYFIPLICLLCIAPISGDGTRVLAILTFPLIVLTLMHNVKVFENLPDRLWTFYFILVLVTPWTFAWAGTPKWSALPFNIAWALHHLFGWPNIPDNLDFWVVNG